MSQDFDINVWLECFRVKLVSLFGRRLRFFGLQGSYGRGEQTAGSDIDVVVVIDGMSRRDIFAYRTMLDTMDRSSMICGFVAGSEELRGWDKSDLLQLFLDTQPIVPDKLSIYKFYKGFIFKRFTVVNIPRRNHKIQKFSTFVAYQM